MNFIATLKPLTEGRAVCLPDWPVEWYLELLNDPRDGNRYLMQFRGRDEPRIFGEGHDDSIPSDWPERTDWKVWVKTERIADEALNNIGKMKTADKPKTYVGDGNSRDFQMLPENVPVRPGYRIASTRELFIAAAVQALLVTSQPVVAARDPNWRLPATFTTNLAKAARQIIDEIIKQENGNDPQA